MPAAAPAIPPKPNTAAASAMTIKITIQRNMFIPPKSMIGGQLVLSNAHTTFTKALRTITLWLLLYRYIYGSDIYSGYRFRYI